MRLKYKLGIVISFFLVFLMSHNAFAFDISPPVNFALALKGSQLQWQDGNGSTWHSGSTNYFYGNTANYTGNQRVFTLSNASHSLSIPAGRYIVISGQFFAASNYQMEINPSGIFGIGNYNADCPIIDLDFTPMIGENSTSTQTYNYTASFNLTCRLASATSVGPSINLSLNNLANPGVSSYGISFTSLLVFNSDNSNSDIYNKLNEIYTWLRNNADDAGSTLRQEKEDVQDASDNSETTAENNSENAQTDNIINVFGSFVSALSSLQPTNCNVTLQWPSSLGGNMTVNVCQNKDKAGSLISIFGSITLLVFYLPLALKLLSMIYNEIRSFTNG